MDTEGHVPRVVLSTEQDASLPSAATVSPHYWLDQLQTQARAGVPPTCAAAFTNVGVAEPWSTSTDVRLLTSTTLQFNPNGLVTPKVGALTFQLSSNVQTRTIAVSGVRNAAVKTP